MIWFKDVQGIRENNIGHYFSLVQGKITGHLHFSWEKPAWFPVKIFPHNNELSGPAQSLFCVLWVIPT